MTKFAQAFKTSGKPFLLYTYSEFNVEYRELIFLENGIEKPVVVSVSFYFDEEKGAFSIQFPRYVDGLDNQYKYQVTFYPNRFEDSFPVAAFSKFSQDFYYELKNLIESGKQVHADFIANYE